MIRMAHDWHEHAAMFDAASDNYRMRRWKRPQRKVEDAEAYLNCGFREWTVEDANDKLHAARVKDGIEHIAKLAMKVAKPCRIRLAVHAQGDGIIHKGKRRTTIQKPKMFTWFYEDMNDKEEVERNALKGMPPKMLSILYGLNIRTAAEKVGIANRVLDKVDKPFARKSQGSAK